MLKAKPKRLYLLIGLGVLIIVLVLFQLTDKQSLSIESCGAVADDGKDDVHAIQACIEQAQSKQLTLEVPEGEYHLSDMITLDGVSMRGEGDKSILISTNPEQGSINMTGEGARLSHLQHQYQTTVERGDGANEKNSITVSKARQFLIDSVKVQQASTAGILVTKGSKEGRITNNIIEGTGADGIHITGQSSQIVVEGNQVKATGDDAIAVVSYRDDGTAVQDIAIKGNRVGYGSRARGIAVVGGETVTIEGNTIQETSMAGIYIATEKNWNTTDTIGVTISQNTINNSGTKPGSDHPNILVYASFGKVDQITFEDNKVMNAEHAGLGMWGEGEIGDVYLTGNHVENSNLSPTQFKKGTVHSSNNVGF
ncbi:right-handed parallel beta-helix repeat-containing protein [Paenibacillus lemnae]|uniref:Right-handed parallel beta-helix repeat-containing protein n=1 Tax=Paenibacillus lemnae TaxID=1330551 RepID=A0A848MBZ6_PAELE|nr:right-handed parallel beta-helix repeat-containing protein [Paenibacillus lemnae]NMO97563.1 right-handed parallel beta-helix repeat-containing protein [Paenibacillus lemnae]